MKKIFIILTIFVSSQCSNEYDVILEGLKKNYVLLSNDIDKDLYLEYFKLSDEQHLKDLEQYNDAVSAFYNADKDILNYLLAYENDTTNICNWIKTKDPYSSSVSKVDLLTNAEGALILFDNYLTNSSSIRVPTYLNKLSFKKLKSFYLLNKRLSKEELKEEYKKLINPSHHP
jgi:hypothetical protein